jgi:hypothetical protein
MNIKISSRRLKLAMIGAIEKDNEQLGLDQSRGMIGS